MITWVPTLFGSFDPSTIARRHMGCVEDGLLESYKKVPDIAMFTRLDNKVFGTVIKAFPRPLLGFERSRWCHCGGVICDVTIGFKG